MLKRQFRAHNTGFTPSAKGFTFIELVIVLFIIGIIIAAVLKAQDLINNARAKRLYSQIIELQIAVLRYYDMYGRFPGDCNRNGVIRAWVNHDVPGEYSYLSDPAEYGSCQEVPNDNEIYEENFNRAFGDLRLANILPRNLSNREVARHSFGHFMAIGFAGIDWSINLPRPNVIVVYNIPVWTARMIDVMADGSINSTAGRIRKTEVSNVPDYGNMSVSEDLKTHIAFYFDRVP